MQNKILVTYATFAGSTFEVAEFIAQTLRTTNTHVDVLPMEKVTDLTPYHAVVAGSAVRAGKFHPQTIKFLKSQQEALDHVPVAYFVVCLTMMEDTEDNRATVTAYVEALHKEVPLIEPVDVGLFGGALNYSKLAFPLKWMFKLAKAHEGDYRDWDAIRTWAIALQPKLMLTTVTA
jgi:menaquinone-dependent protoporphyrinogen oxidase